MGREIVTIPTAFDDNGDPVHLPEIVATRRRVPGSTSTYVPQRKPTADETPHRSRLYVNGRHSADGNAYKPGEPIPDVEFERQERLRPHRGLGARVFNICPACRGSGKQNYRPTHKTGCRCVACRPCKTCSGSGEVEITAASSS